MADPISSRTSASDVTVLNDADHPAPKLSKSIFAEPGSIPLPDHGFHELGVAFEGVTVYGAGQTGGSLRTVEGLEIALLKVSPIPSLNLQRAVADALSLKMWNFPSFVRRLFNLKLGSTRPLICGSSQGENDPTAH